MGGALETCSASSCQIHLKRMMHADVYSLLWPWKWKVSHTRRARACVCVCRRASVQLYSATVPPVQRIRRLPGERGGEPGHQSPRCRQSVPVPTVRPVQRDAARFEPPSRLQRVHTWASAHRGKWGQLTFLEKWMKK